MLLNQPEIRLYLPFSNWFGSKRTSVWFRINRKMVNKIWFRVDLITFLCVYITCERKFRSIFFKYLSRYDSEAMNNCRGEEMRESFRVFMNYKAFRHVPTLFVQGRNLVPSRPAIGRRKVNKARQLWNIQGRNLVPSRPAIGKQTLPTNSRSAWYKVFTLGRI